MTGMIGLLRAVSEQAKKNTAAGGPDIQLTGMETYIGRSVPKQPGLPLPMLWAQISGRHCIFKGNTTEVAVKAVRLENECGFVSCRPFTATVTFYHHGA